VNTANGKYHYQEHQVPQVMLELLEPLVVQDQVVHQELQEMMELLVHPELQE